MQDEIQGPRELYIFPTRNKQPLTPQGFKNARPESQWTGRESTEWGLPCGERNGVFVVDVDNKPDENGLTGVKYHEQKGTDWGHTLKVETPSGGYHVFYRYTEAVRLFKNSVRIDTGTDFRTEGGYVVLYAPIDSSGIREIPKNLLDYFIAKNESRRKNLVANDSKDAIEGSRNAFLTRQAGKMQRLGVLTLTALQEVNFSRCSPPLYDGEVMQIFNSISRYAPEPELALPDQQKEANGIELIDDMLEYLRNDAAIAGESTGIAQLDDLLGGGKRLGELSVMLAEAKSGKNTFWHYQMVKMMDRGLAMAYASRELDPATEVMPNLVTLAMQQNVYKNRLTADAIKERIQKWKLVFSEGIGQYDDPEDLFKWIEAKVEEGIKYFWIDHLHFCLPDSEDFKALSSFIRKLRTMSRGRMVHIDLIIQPKGGTTQHTKSGKLIDNDLDIGMLRGGASLGQGLDNLITMQRSRDDEGNKIDVSKITLKTTRNKLAKLGSFYVSYDREKMTFQSCNKPDEDIQVEHFEPGSNIHSRRAERAERKHRSPKHDTPLFDLSANGFNLKKEIK